MKKSITAFYIKVALAVGVPALCVAAAVAINNKTEVCENEIYIIENESEVIVSKQSGEIESAIQNVIESAQSMQVEPVSTESASINPVPIESTTPIAPTESVPAEPEPTESEPTEPAPTQPQPTTENENSSGYEVKYTYDLLGRLIRAEYEWYIIEYVYDGNGNILRIKKTFK